MFSDIKILVLGASVYHISLFKKLNELQIPFISVSYYSDDPAVQFANLFYPISSTAIDELAELIQNERITHIVTTASDANTFSLARLNELFGFEGVLPKQVDAVSHKPNLVALITALGLPSPFTKVLQLSLGEAEHWLNQPTPYIFKPARGSGSVGVFTRLKDFPVENVGQLYMVQEYIDGGDISGQAIIENGETVFLAFSKKWAVNEYVPFVHWISDDLKKKIGQEIARQLFAINDSVGFKNGTVSFDLRLGKHPFIIDYSYRLSGNLLIEAMNLAYNVDIYEHHILQLLNKPRNLSPSFLKQQVCAIIFGTSRMRADLESIRAQIEFTLYKSSDITVHELLWDNVIVSKPFINSRNRIGHALLSSRSIENLQKIALEIKAILELE